MITLELADTHALKWAQQQRSIAVTIRFETNATGEPTHITVDGIAYTPEQLRQHLARSQALDTVIHWHADAERRARRWRQIARVLWRVCRRLGADMDQHTAYLQQQHNRRLNADPAAPWRVKERQHDDRMEALEDALRRVLQWTEAYPVERFPDQDMAAARAVLDAAGINMGALHGQWARHIFGTIGNDIRAVLSEDE